MGPGGRRRILNKDYTLLRDDQDPDDVEESNKKSGASAWRLVGLAKEQAFVRSRSQYCLIMPQGASGPH